MNVLVTGGAGYIGSHTCKALAAAGHRPVTFDNMSRGHKESVRWGPLIQGDLLATELLRQVLRDHQISAVLHFAALAYVGESMQAAARYFQNNVCGTLSLLQAMLAENVNKLVFSSTCAVFGSPERIPIDERHPREPVNAYGDTKLVIEKALRWFGQAHGLKWVVLRYFNAAGADIDGELGESHHPETHLIPLALGSLLEGAEPVQVFGTDYPTEDGSAVRDYVHVTDLADAHVKALRYVTGESQSKAFNLGTGRGFSVREVLKEIELVTGRRPKYVDCPRRPGDPAVLVADSLSAKKELEWSPQFSDLPTIIRTAWNWQTRSSNGSRN